MSENLTYECDICGRTTASESEGDAPICCQQSMAPLESCTTTQTPEMARAHIADEPCNDGTQAST